MTDANDKYGNVSNIPSGGLSINEIAQAEAARAQADAERAATLTVETSQRAGYDRQPYTKSHEGGK